MNTWCWPDDSHIFTIVGAMTSHLCVFLCAGYSRNRFTSLDMQPFTSLAARACVMHAIAITALKQPVAGRYQQHAGRCCCHDSRTLSSSARQRPGGIINRCPVTTRIDQLYYSHQQSTQLRSRIRTACAAVNFSLWTTGARLCATDSRDCACFVKLHFVYM